MDYIIDSISNYNLETLEKFAKKNKVCIDDKKRNNDYYKRYLLGQYLLSKLLAKNYNLKYMNIMFKTCENGKKYIDNKDIYFNISYSFDYVAVCTSNHEIGIDIEKIRKTNRTYNIFATDAEVSYITEFSDTLFERLFKIFTLKEAYFKMYGTGIFKSNLKDVGFKVTDDGISCSDTTVKIYNFKKDDYIISICEKKDI